MQNIFPTRRELQDQAAASTLGDTQIALTSTLLSSMITAATSNIKNASIVTSGKTGADVHTTITLLRTLGYDCTLDGTGTLRVSWS